MKTTFFAHETAVIGNGCTIGAGTKIWHFSQVMSGAQIGSDCIFGQNTFIADAVRIGDRVKVQNNVSLYNGLHIADDVFLGPSCVFTNVKTPRAFVDRRTEFKNTFIEKGVSIGANATIVCGITIGEYALIGAGAVVSKSVVPHALVTGVPAVQQGWVCRCGVVLETSLQCSECLMQYKKEGEGIVAQQISS